MFPLARLPAIFSFAEDRAAAGERPPRLSSRSAWRLVLLLFARPLFQQLGSFDLDNDETIYSHGVLSIVQQGAWGSPWSSPGSGPFLEKPPLKLWLVALGILAGLPADESGLRFFDPIFGALAFLYLYALGFRAGGIVAGLGAVASLFLFEPLLFEHGLRTNSMDAALLLAYCGGAWHTLAFFRQAPGAARGRLHLVAATLFFTLGFLVKFVAALFLPLVAAVACLLLPEPRRRLREQWGLLLAAAGLFLALAAPWFVYQHFEHGALFWRTILGQHVVERFTHHLDPQHLHPFFYYFATIFRELAAGGALPWVLAGGVLWLAASWRSRSFFGLFVLLWASLPLLLISCGTSKLLHYAYPFLPPLGLFAGFALAQAWRAGRELVRRPGAGMWRAAGIAGLLVLGVLGGLRPAAHYRRIAARISHGGHLLRDLATCIGSGQARTLVDGGRERPLVSCTRS